MSALSPDNEIAQGRAEASHEPQLIAVANAAEALHRGYQLEMGAVQMHGRWRRLEKALNEWKLVEEVRL